MNKRINREEYLKLAKQELAIIFKKEAGVKIPRKVKVSCGFPITSPRPTTKGQAVGECHSTTVSSGGYSELFISPVKSDSLEVLGILAHELIHASDDNKSKHRGYFRKTALAIGLTGKMTATTIGDELKPKVKAIIKKLGKYPHAAIDISGRKKQSTRLIKVECIKCDTTWRCSRSAIESATLDRTDMVCFACGQTGLEINLPCTCKECLNGTNGEHFAPAAMVADSTSNKKPQLKSIIKKEWHYEKNYPKTPQDFTPMSAKKVWFTCKDCQWVYEAIINNRTRGSGCPACAGKVVISENCLNEKFPEIAKDWHWEKNAPLTPEDVTGKSSKRVWWKCQECHHEWQATINDRTNRGSTGCRQCYKAALMSTKRENTKNQRESDFNLAFEEFKNNPELIIRRLYKNIVLCSRYDRGGNDLTTCKCNTCVMRRSNK